MNNILGALSNNIRKDVVSNNLTLETVFRARRADGTFYKYYENSTIYPNVNGFSSQLPSKLAGTLTNIQGLNIVNAALSAANLLVCLHGFHVTLKQLAEIRDTLRQVQAKLDEIAKGVNAINHKLDDHYYESYKNIFASVKREYNTLSRGEYDNFKTEARFISEKIAAGIFRVQSLQDRLIRNETENIIPGDLAINMVVGLLGPLVSLIDNFTIKFYEEFKRCPDDFEDWYETVDFLRSKEIKYAIKHYLDVECNNLTNEEKLAVYTIYKQTIEEALTNMISTIIWCREKYEDSDEALENG